MKYISFALFFSISAFSSAQTTIKKNNQAKKSTTTTTKSTAKSATKPSTVTSVVKAASSAISGTSITEADISAGLKEALNIGAKNASSQLNALDGFNKNPLVRIPFPPDAIKVADALRKYGYGSQVDDFELKLNRAAEQAAKDAAPIFGNVISQITLNDAKSILQGPDNAATSFLQTKTTESLYTSFSPTIKTALGNTLATSSWTEITALYNKLPFVTPVETDLVKYTTNKALSGLFHVVADEEKKIRDNPAARTSEILQKVFGSISK